MIIGQKIKFIRTFRNMTQKELGSALGFSSNTIEIRVSQYEKGIREPREAILSRIAEILNVSYFILLDSNDNVILDTIFNLFWNEVQLYQYSKENKLVNELFYDNCNYNLISDTGQSNDLLILVLKEIKIYKTLVLEKKLVFEDYINFMLLWSYKSMYASQLLN